MKKYKAVIIGCGKIAGGYDSLQNKDILSHANALNVHKKTSLSGVYDIVTDKGQRFARKWKTTAYPRLRMLMEKVRPEIVYICVPDDQHALVLKRLLKYQPKIVVCEKPLTTDINSGRSVVSDYKKKKIPLVVNYSRRFDPVMQEIKNSILKKNYGLFINGLFIYTKGILHNGSHAIDLLRLFFGEPESTCVLDGIIDYKKEDPALDVILKFKNNIKIYLLAGDERKYSIFEADFLFSKSRIRLTNFGMEYQLQSVRKKTKLGKALLFLIDNIINHLEKKEQLLSTGENAFKTQKICLKLIEEYKMKKKEGKC